MDTEIEVLNKNMTIHKFEHFDIQPVFSADLIHKIQEDTKKIYLSPKIERYLVSIVDSTRYAAKYKLKHASYIAWGASPRASIGLFISAKANALIHGRTYVIPEDVKVVAKDVLRHRLLLTYEAQAENISTIDIINEILHTISVP
ncbi:MAG: MoxR family ATPase [Candidatus Woesearchaeota archaeon]